MLFRSQRGRTQTSAESFETGLKKIGTEGLQRGRTQTSAERGASSPVSRVISGFNGAALKRVRKVRSRCQSFGPVTRWLQRGRTQTSAESATDCGYSFFARSLQRGRTQTSAESLSVSCQLSRLGLCFNGAALKRVRKVIAPSGNSL